MLPYASRTVMPLPTTHPSGDRGSPLVVWLIVFALMLVVLALSAGSSKQRRARFWLRVTLCVGALPVLVAAVLGGVAVVGDLPDAVAGALLVLLVFLFVPALFLVPALLYRSSGSPPDSPGDNGGGWRPGPDQPPAPPRVPRGGLPRPDAEQARIRVRDHIAPDFDPVKPRRPAREPDRAPARHP
jgi:hypothetical protein